MSKISFSEQNMLIICACFLWLPCQPWPTMMASMRLLGILTAEKLLECEYCVSIHTLIELQSAFSWGHGKWVPRLIYFIEFLLVGSSVIILVLCRSTRSCINIAFPPPLENDSAVQVSSIRFYLIDSVACLLNTLKCFSTLTLI